MLSESLTFWLNTGWKGLYGWEQHGYSVSSGCALVRRLVPVAGTMKRRFVLAEYDLDTPHIDIPGIETLDRNKGPLGGVSREMG